MAVLGQDGSVVWLAMRTGHARHIAQHSYTDRLLATCHRGSRSLRVLRPDEAEGRPMCGACIRSAAHYLIVEAGHITAEAAWR